MPRARCRSSPSACPARKRPSRAERHTVRVVEPEVTVDQDDRLPAGVERRRGLLAREARVVRHGAVAVVVGARVIGGTALDRIRSSPGSSPRSARCSRTTSAAPSDQRANATPGGQAGSSLAHGTGGHDSHTVVAYPRVRSPASSSPGRKLQWRLRVFDRLAGKFMSLRAVRTVAGTPTRPPIRVRVRRPIAAMLDASGT
jgi:hypothetical protein